MSNIIYSITGCTRCKITKRFMTQQGIAFEDSDVQAEGREAFASINALAKFIEEHMEG